MTAGFMFVTMEDVVFISRSKFFVVAAGVLCLEGFQSMLTKITRTSAVLCSSDPVPFSVAADDVEADLADDIALLKQMLESITARAHAAMRCNDCYFV